MTSEIRLASVKDAGMLSRISFESWKYENRHYLSQKFIDSVSPTHWAASFKNGMSTNRLKFLMISEVSNSGVFEDVGCISYGRSPEKDCSDSAEIFSIYVLPDKFDRGYGTDLLRTSLNDISAYGFNSCGLWVSEENERARLFYEKENFDYTGEVSSAFLDGSEIIQYKMIKNLK